MTYTIQHLYTKIGGSPNKRGVVNVVKYSPTGNNNQWEMLTRERKCLLLEYYSVLPEIAMMSRYFSLRKLRGVRIVDLEWELRVSGFIFTVVWGCHMNFICKSRQLSGKIITRNLTLRWTSFCWTWWMILYFVKF